VSKYVEARPLLQTMTEHFKRQEERASKRAGGEEDYDEGKYHESLLGQQHGSKTSLLPHQTKTTPCVPGVEEHLEDEDEEDVYILSKVGDVVHALFSTHRDAFLPAFERLLPHFTRLLQPGRPWSDLQWGLCIFDDLLEYTGNPTAAVCCGQCCGPGSEVGSETFCRIRSRIRNELFRIQIRAVRIRNEFEAKISLIKFTISQPNAQLNVSLYHTILIAGVGSGSGV
jgi:hypothetical protein